MFLAKPTGHSELLHRHGMERRSWQGTRLMLPPLTPLLQVHEFFQLMSSPPQDVAFCSLSGIVPAPELAPSVHPGHWPNVSSTGRTSLAPQPPSQLLPLGTKSLLPPFFPTEAYQSHFLRPF